MICRQIYYHTPRLGKTLHCRQQTSIQVTCPSQNQNNMLADHQCAAWMILCGGQLEGTVFQILCWSCKSNDLSGHWSSTALQGIMIKASQRLHEVNEYAHINCCLNKAWREPVRWQVTNLGHDLVTAKKQTSHTNGACIKELACYNDKDKAMDNCYNSVTERKQPWSNPLLKTLPHIFLCFGLMRPFEISSRCVLTINPAFGCKVLVYHYTLQTSYSSHSLTLRPCFLVDSKQCNTSV